jgi:hypothetical protein
MSLYDVKQVFTDTSTPQDTKPDETAEIEYRTAYLWIVPAKVDGEWAWRQPIGKGTPEFTMELRQQFQMISGPVKIDNENFWLTDARLRGEEISFTVIGDAGGVRIRHGDWRAVCEIDGREMIVLVVRIGHRKDVYR